MKSVPVRATCPSQGCGELPCLFRDSLISAKLKIFLADRCSKVNMGFSEGGGDECWKIKNQEKWRHIKEKKNGPLELEFQCSCRFFPIVRMSKETNLPFYQITTQLNGK